MSQVKDLMLKEKRKRKMKKLPSNKILMRNYGLNEENLFKIMNECIGYYLSEEELATFIYEYYHKFEMRLNKRHQK